jgi:dihydroorotase
LAKTQRPITYSTLNYRAETHLFQNDIPLQREKITTEVSHHLWFSDKDYERLGMLIKWNPAIKTEQDKEGLLKALLDDRIDIITTDHAPHTLEEKEKPYFQSMSGARWFSTLSIACWNFINKNSFQKK